MFNIVSSASTWVVLHDQMKCHFTVISLLNLLKNEVSISLDLSTHLLTTRNIFLFVWIMSQNGLRWLHLSMLEMLKLLHSYILRSSLALVFPGILVLIKDPSSL